MTSKQLIELVQQHHPHMGETEILLLLNQSMREFCEDTKMLASSNVTIDTVSGTRWYTLPDFNTNTLGAFAMELLSIKEVYLDDVKIPRLQGNPIIEDGS